MVTRSADIKHECSLYICLMSGSIVWLSYNKSILLWWGFFITYINRIKRTFKQYKHSGLSDETLKAEVPCTGSYPYSCQISQTVCRKSRGLPRMYWTSPFFSRGKHLMANELCAIHVKYIKFKKKDTGIDYYVQ